MKFFTSKHSVGAVAVAAILILLIALPASASVLNGQADESASVMTFSKNGSATNEINFSKSDFRVAGSGNLSLDSIIISAMPAREAGILMIGDELLAVGDVISVSALDGLKFHPTPSTKHTNTSFQFTPVFSSGESGKQVEVMLYLLTEENNAPVAENLEFVTYKNVAYTGQFSAVDPEGDLITFQLVDKPARGSIEFSEDGGAEFVYTPYENKTGKDSFTYVAVDAVGNTSKEAEVKIRIEKPTTKVTYADMEGHPAYNAAIRLAEEKIFVGANMNGNYYFQPDIPITRVEFLAMAMAAVDSDVLDGITSTGFYDDDSIQTWAKPYVASALKAGTVQGSVNRDGQIVFCADNTITEAEAAVLMNRILSVSDVSEETWLGKTEQVPTWACQAVMNLETVGMIQKNADGEILLNQSMTRADAAKMLSAALDLIETRSDSDTWFSW